MTTMMTRLQSTIKLFASAQLPIVALWAISFSFFINFEVAFMSAFIIMLGSMYSYSALVKKRVAEYEGMEVDDLIEKIDDPYDLYDEAAEDVADGEGSAKKDEEQDLKTVIKEEKKRLKGRGAKNLQKTAPAVASLYRLVPYLFLVLGFVALNNNGLLSLWPYMLGLGTGVVVGVIVGRKLFISQS